MKEKLSFISTRGRKKRIIIGIVLLGIVGFVYVQLNKKPNPAPSEITTVVEAGSLITSISASGQISNANSGSIGTQASGVVAAVYVKNGERVSQGQKIAEIELDESGKQNYYQALSSYQSSKNSVENANASLLTQQADLYTQWKKFTDLASNSYYTNGDGSPNTQHRELPEFIIAQSTWLATEVRSKNQQNVLAQAQTSLAASSLALQESSPIIYAPISGSVTGLSLQAGTVLTTQTASTGTITSQKVASIKTNAPPTVVLNLTEIDIPTVAIGNKATVTLSAFPDVTYTGEVISIDTIGSVSSGVTTYPTVIQFDSEVPEIFSNMSATANIITHAKHDVLLVPNKAITTTQGVSTVVKRTKNGDVPVVVETGMKSTMQTEIVSGVSAGDTVVQPIVAVAKAATNQTQSPFSTFGGAGGGAIRIAR